VNPNQRGATSEAAIAFEATRAGVDVFTPLSGHCRYDLLFDIGSQLYRVQCKTACLQGEVLVVKLVSSWHTPGGYVRNGYQPGEIDLVAAYCHELERAFLFPFEIVPGKTGIQLRLSPPGTAKEQRYTSRPITSSPGL
jgi:hypothetical protein